MCTHAGSTAVYGLFSLLYVAGLGYCMILVSGMACIYYNAVLSWIIYYLFSSFTSSLPWAECGHWWNTPTCYDKRHKVAPCNVSAYGNVSAVASNFGLDSSLFQLFNSSFSKDLLENYHRASDNLNLTAEEKHVLQCIISSRSKNNSIIGSSSALLLNSSSAKVPKSAAEEFWQ
jgi:hypothetical protein